MVVLLEVFVRCQVSPQSSPSLLSSFYFIFLLLGLGNGSEGGIMIFWFCLVGGLAGVLVLGQVLVMDLGFCEMFCGLQWFDCGFLFIFRWTLSMLGWTWDGRDLRIGDDRDGWWVRQGAEIDVGFWTEMGGMGFSGGVGFVGSSRARLGFGDLGFCSEVGYDGEAEDDNDHRR
eukprot:TRINITY_DN2937_c1_g1_i5.p1 TRINITY_DN2937_c1_g1~~TRINITY_DN2937_c1_g1_i5.p1  ORF type:complete len:173 (-),score=37.60 TRINITY_DN2937_c1_g1_i5:214-732(-)